MSSLATADETHNQHGPRILFPLLKFMYQYAIEYFGITHLAIAVNPKWYPFYESVLLFQKHSAKTVDCYDFVNGAPAIGGVLDLTQAPLEYGRVYGRRPDGRDLLKFFTELPPTNMEFPLRQHGAIFDPVLTPDLVRTFFLEKTQVLHTLTDPERVFLRQQYEGTAIRDLIPKPKIVPIFSRAEKRFDTRLNARLKLPGDRSVPVTVLNVSLFGLGGFAHNVVEPGVYELHVDSGDMNACVLVGEIHWITPKRIFGFSLRSAQAGPSPQWRDFIDTLETRLKNEKTLGAERGKIAVG